MASGTVVSTATPNAAATAWPWHAAQWTAIPVCSLAAGDRRFEAETYLSSGYGIRSAMEARATGRDSLGAIARVWQPPRLKGIQVDQEHGTPFLAASQVFEVRPALRKWLALERTGEAKHRFVDHGTVLVTCSGNVGRAALAQSYHLRTLITHDLLRVQPKALADRGWIYAYLRAPKARAMMSGARYGHIIKHLEVEHLRALPVPLVSDAWKAHFQAKAKCILDLRDQAYAATLEAEARYATALGHFTPSDNGESGFTVRASETVFATRRLDGTRFSPGVRGTLEHIRRNGRRTSSLQECGYRVWVPGRYKRVPADDGVVFLDSAELFEVNPDQDKRFADSGFGDPDGGRVKRGWLLMASSGQTYGIVGGTVLASSYHEGKALANHVIRIAPGKDVAVRAGYLLTALAHPLLGRPVIKSYAFGSSVPEISPDDVKGFPVPRLCPADEDAIADLAERSAELRALADATETAIAAQADELIRAYMAGEQPAEPLAAGTLQA